MSYRSLWLAAAAAVASGVLFLLSVDLGPIGPLALIAPTPVLVYALVSRRTWTVALAAFAARAIGGLGTALAYAGILPPLVLIAWTVILALLFTLVVLATRWIAHSAPAWAATLAYAAFATTAEFLFSRVSPHGSFGAIGYALVDLLPLLQIASMGGLAALSFCAGLCAMGLAVLATTPRAWPSVALVAGAPLLLVLAFGAWRLSEPYDERVRVALITNDALRGRASGGGPATREVALSYAEALRARR